MAKPAAPRDRVTDDRAFRLLVDSVVDYAVFLLDTEGHVVSLNRGAEHIKGYRADEIIGSHFSRFYSAEDIAAGKPARALADAVRNGSVEDEGWRVRKDGTRFWANVVITALRDEAGNLTGFGKVTRDLTHRRAAEEAQRRLAEERTARTAAEGSAERLARLQQTTAALAHAQTPHEAGQAVLRHGLGLFGGFAGSVYWRDDADPTRVRYIASWGLPDEVYASFQTISVDSGLPSTTALQAGRALFVDTVDALRARFPAVRAHLDARTGAYIALPLFVRGVAEGYISIALDAPHSFTDEDRRFAEVLAQQCAQAIDRARLAQRDRVVRERAQFLAQAGSVLNASLDARTILQTLAQLVVPRMGDWVNVIMFEGDTPKQWAIAHADPAKLKWAIELQQRFPRHIKSEGPESDQLRAGKPLLYKELPQELVLATAINEEHRAVLREIGLRSSMVIPLMGRGKLLGVMTFVWSETPRNYDEADVEDAMELGRRAALAVQNALLFSEATDAIRLRDDFLAVAGHELRTPLAALTLQLQTLQRKVQRIPEANPLLEQVNKSARSAFRLDTLIGQLLDVTRITSGRLRLEPEPMDLRAVVDDVVARFADVADRVGCVVTVDGPTRLQGTWDRLRIDQVLSNLLSNAFKYGKGHPVAVSLRSDDDHAVVDVRDQGIGIDPAEQKRIFDRFERSAAGHDYGGLGLGLWISKQIVLASGGVIDVASMPGRGATFRVRLPRAAPAPAAEVV